MAAARFHSWSTSEAEPGQALAYWSETVFQSMLEIDSPARSEFNGRMDVRDLGPATLYRTTVDMQTARRTRSLISRRGLSGYVLVHNTAGELAVSQRDRSMRLRAGDSTLLDLDQPYVLDGLTPTRSLMLHFEKDWLRNWIPSPDAIVATEFTPDRGWSSALTAALRSMDSTFEEPFVLPPGTVAEQFAALLALAAGHAAQATPSSSKLFQRVRRTLQDRCHEPGLDPSAIAAEHGISKRYLHHIFATESTTFRAELMRLRLEQARRMLADTRFDSVAISEVSARCGFLEPSHFARRFRLAFGTGPRRFRSSRD